MKRAITHYWCAPMFVFGFLRSWRGEHHAPVDLVTHKLFTSTCNGLWYATPYGIFPLGRLINRIQIHMTNKNPADYKPSYDEIFVKNYNTIL
jgi:hypothetical protein